MIRERQASSKFTTKVLNFEEGTQAFAVSTVPPVVAGTVRLKALVATLPLGHHNRGMTSPVGLRAKVGTVRAVHPLAAVL